MKLRDYYYDADQIQVGTINWELITEESSALASFESGDYVYSDMCPDEEKPRMEGNGLVYTEGNNNYCVMFNLGDKGNEVLKDVNVRKALSLTIDRERIMNIRGLNDEVGVTLACRGYENADGTDFVDYCDPWEDVEAYDENCETAKQLLAEAGYEDGKGFPALTYIVNNDKMCIRDRDYTMIMGVTIFYSALIVFMNLICDILYKIVDPRIKLD